VVGTDELSLGSDLPVHGELVEQLAGDPGVVAGVEVDAHVLGQPDSEAVLETAQALERGA
jgi:hypothetical protein